MNTHHLARKIVEHPEHRTVNTRLLGSAGQRFELLAGVFAQLQPLQIGGQLVG